jgi:CheY-like chemotaxis protein
MTPLANGRYKVLVVDDDPSVLRCYRRLLDRAGYTTVTKDDPLEVLEEDGSTDGVDLILLDYKMPGIDGISLLAELRRRECRARCILISAYLNEEVRSQAEHLGVDHVLDKPVDVERLRGAIGRLLPVHGGQAKGSGVNPAGER